MNTLCAVPFCIDTSPKAVPFNVKPKNYNSGAIVRTATTGWKPHNHGYQGKGCWGRNDFRLTRDEEREWDRKLDERNAAKIWEGDREVEDENFEINCICGEPMELIHPDLDSWQIECPNCRAAGPRLPSKAEAIDIAALLFQ